MTNSQKLAKWSLKRRLVWLLSIGGVIIVGAAFYVYFFLSLTMGSGPAGPAVPAEPFQETWTERTVLLVGLGDSVTAGFGASSGKSYFQRLVANPPDEFPDMQGRSLSKVLPNLEPLNLSVSGSNSLDHVKQIVDRLPPQDESVFGLVVMTTGGNDLIHWYGRTPPREGAMYGATLEQAQPWIANYEARLDTMFTEIEKRFPGGCLIYVADIYDPSDGVGDPESVWLPAWPDCVQIVTEYNATLRRVAAKHPQVRIVPVHDTFLGHGIHCRQFWREHYSWSDPHFWYLSNIEDPNDRGYDALRRLFLIEIAMDREVIAAAASSDLP